MGSVVKEFEDAVASFVGGDPSPHVVAVNTGTTAMHIALSALGVGAGDEVVIPSLTFVATAQIVTATGATPVFCDIEEDTLNIDVNYLKKCITKSPTMPVHYRGVPGNISTLTLAKTIILLLSKMLHTPFKILLRQEHGSLVT